MTMATYADLPPYGIRGDYQREDTTQTLREGLAEYYAVNPGLSVPSTLEHAPSARYFHNHDCTHVVFGTHTGDLDEGVNDLLTFFGVSVRIRDYITGFTASTEAAAVGKHYLSPRIVPLFVNTMRLFPTVVRVCRKMTKRWPWDPPEAYLDRSLADLRAEYGIELFRPDEVLGLA